MSVAARNRSLKLYRAFADPTRLRLLCLLRGAAVEQPGGNSEICVCDLVSILGVPQPTASRHLAYLRRAGLVQSRRDGLWAYYRLSPAGGPVHRKLLETLEACAAAMPEMTSDARRLRVVCCASGCC
jgi:ArsR family transcriptional regulator